MSYVLEALEQAETPRQRYSFGNGFGLSFDADPAEDINDHHPVSPAMPALSPPSLDADQRLPIFTLGGPSVSASILPASPTSAAATLSKTSGTAAAAAAASAGGQATDDGDVWSNYFASLDADGIDEGISWPAYNPCVTSPLLVSTIVVLSRGFFPVEGWRPGLLLCRLGGEVRLGAGRSTLAQ